MTQIIRVGEKNNFNFSDKEKEALKAYEKEGRSFFVNSNSKVTIDADFKSIVTINPDLVFEMPKGDLSNVSAFRVKLFMTDDIDYMWGQLSALTYVAKENAKVLVTFMRFKSKKTLSKYCGLELSGNAKKDKAMIEEFGYVYDSGYYRPNKDIQGLLKTMAKNHCGNKTFICDENGTGCPDCGNCASLNGFPKETEIASLNLSVSGIKDKNGKQGICPFNCPDCWAKIVTYGKSPACDKIIKNRKQKGEINHV